MQNTKEVMKYNERELAAWASALVPDKEGILEKKGTGIGQGKHSYHTVFHYFICL